MLHNIATASPCPVKMCKGTEVTFRCIPKAATDFVGFCCFLFSVFCIDCDGKTVGLYSATLSYLKINMAELTSFHFVHILQPVLNYILSNIESGYGRVGF